MGGKTGGYLVGYCAGPRSRLCAARGSVGRRGRRLMGAAMLNWRATPAMIYIPLAIAYLACSKRLGMRRFAGMGPDPFLIGDADEAGAGRSVLALAWKLVG